MQLRHAWNFRVGLVALCAVWFHTQAATAQTPTISSISGTQTQGAVLTITGANLNAESKANWEGFFLKDQTAWSFEGSDAVSDGYGLGNTTTGVYDSSVKLLGNQSIKFHSQAGPCTGAGIGGDYNYIGGAGVNNYEWWLRVYVRWNRITNFPSNYIKMLYAMGAAYYFEPSGAGLGSNPGYMDSAYSGVSHKTAVPGGPIQNNRWYLVELHWKSSAPYMYESWMDGVLMHSGTPTSTGNTGKIGGLLFGIINACGSAGSWDVEHWMDGLAVGSQRIYGSSVVEVADSPNYASAHKTVQPLEKIADDEVQFHLDTSGLGPGPYYVFVTNNRRAVSQGYYLGGTQSGLPAAPANLRLVP